MYNYKITKIFIAIGFMLLVTGCVKDQDFDQANEIEITPQIEADLVYLKLTQKNFVNSSGEAEVSFVSQKTSLNFLQDGFVQDDLRQIDFTFDSENSFPQSFNTTVTFFDENGETAYEFSFFVPGSETGEPIKASHVEVIEGDDLQLFKNAVSIEVNSSIILNGQPIMGELDFKSKASLYFEFN